MTLQSRRDELRTEAQKKNVAGKVHQFNLVQSILAYAELLGYRIPEALDPDIPLIKL